MGMFDTVLDDQGREWQTKALGKRLDVYRIGDEAHVAFAPASRLDTDDLHDGLLDTRIGPRARDCQISGLAYSGRDGDDSDEDFDPELDLIAYTNALIAARKAREAGKSVPDPVAPPTHYVTIRDGRIVSVGTERDPSLPLFSNSGFEITAVRDHGADPTWRTLYDLLACVGAEHELLLNVLTRHLTRHLTGPADLADTGGQRHVHAFNDAIVALTPALIAFGVVLQPVEDPLARAARFADWEKHWEACQGTCELATRDERTDKDGPTDREQVAEPATLPETQSVEDDAAWLDSAWDGTPWDETAWDGGAWAETEEDREEKQRILTGLRRHAHRRAWFAEHHAPVRRTFLAVLRDEDTGAPVAEADLPGWWRGAEAAHANVRTQPGQWHTSPQAAIDTFADLAEGILAAIETLAQLRDLAEPHIDAFDMGVFYRDDRTGAEVLRRGAIRARTVLAAL